MRTSERYFLNKKILLEKVSRYSPVKVEDWAYLQVDSREKEGLKALLTLQSYGKNPFVVRAYKESNGLLGVPRALYTPTNREKKWENVEINFYGELRPEQQKLYNAFIESNAYGGIIKATTGVGKTVLALAISSYYSMPTLVIVPTTTIFDQWVKAIKTFCKQEAGIIRQNICKVKTFSVAMLHSLAQRGDYGLKSKFGVVIYDEIHKIPARTFSRTAGMFDCFTRIGLSATPRRKDGMENIFLWHIGNIVASHKATDVKPKAILIKYYSMNTSHTGCVWNGELQLGRYINKIAKDEKRNKMIASIIDKAYEQGREILVLSDRLNQIYQIAGALSVPENCIGFMTSKIKQKEKKVILATYGCAGIGFDKPTLDTLIFATPHADIEQAVGRLLRKTDRKKDPIIIDIVDVASNIMVKWSEKRLKFYISAGCEVRRK